MSADIERLAADLRERADAAQAKARDCEAATAHNPATNWWYGREDGLREAARALEEVDWAPGELVEAYAR